MTSKKKGPLRVVIAGGGTGGHLFPGIAVAEKFRERFEDARLLFVVGKKKMESDILKRLDYQVEPIDIQGIMGRGWIKTMGVLAKLPSCLWQSRNVLRAFSPAFVLGMGGYSAGPVCVAARFMGIPTAVHEQNSFPGLTNRLLARVVDRVFISFEESRDHFGGKTPILTGNPVRLDFFSMPPHEPESGAPFTVLVTGGSQGARAINRAFAEALEILKKGGKSLAVIHQTGGMDHENVVQDYRQRGIQGDLAPFIEDMTGAYGRADLVVGRAGATTLFELAAMGKPSILVPYPHAANQHQETNARALVRAGAADMILEDQLTGASLAERLTAWMEDPALLKDMGRKARGIARPRAADEIVDRLMDMGGF